MDNLKFELWKKIGTLGWKSGEKLKLEKIVNFEKIWKSGKVWKFGKINESLEK